MKEGEKFSSSEDFARSLEPKLRTQDHKPALKPVQKTPEPVQESPVHHYKPEKKAPTQPLHPRRKLFEGFAGIFLLFLLFVVVFLAISTNASPFIIMVTLLPTMFTIIVAILLYDSRPNNKNILWPIPLVVIIIFYYIALEFRSFLGSADIDTLTALNVVLSYLYIIINHFLLQSKSTEAKTKVKVVVKEADIPDDLATFIASIEDKSKALNFVIGRVYNAYHGGSKDLREMINMKQDWYDQFSKVPDDPAQIDFNALNKLIVQIERRLHQLEKSEAEVFGLRHKEFKNLVRDDSGADKIIDVLDKNDKDPVRTYYDGALQFCGKVRDFMKNRQAPEVKNEYVERPDEKSAPRSSSLEKAKSLLR